jgi:hypothetical protein
MLANEQNLPAVCKAKGFFAPFALQKADLDKTPYGG